MCFVYSFLNVLHYALVRNSGSPMLGERNRVCDEVGWDLVEATSSPSYNNNNTNNNGGNSNGAHQSNWTSGGGGGSNSSGPGGGARTELNTRNTSCISRISRNSRDDDEEDYDDATNIQYASDAIGGGGAGENMSVNGGNAGKEVRYAPLPLDAQSPTHSNQINQASLQRTHSRYTSACIIIIISIRLRMRAQLGVSFSPHPFATCNLYMCDFCLFHPSFTRVM